MYIYLYSSIKLFVLFYSTSYSSTYIHIIVGISFKVCESLTYYIINIYTYISAVG